MHMRAAAGQFIGARSVVYLKMSDPIAPGNVSNFCPVAVLFMALSSQATVNGIVDDEDRSGDAPQSHSRTNHRLPQ